jgi:hypothetical protein
MAFDALLLLPFVDATSPVLVAVLFVIFPILSLSGGDFGAEQAGCVKTRMKAAATHQGVVQVAGIL